MTLRRSNVVVDLYGNYARYRGAGVRVQDLLTLLSAFEIGEETARVTLSRLKRRGWLETRREARTSWYYLTDLGLRELNEGHDRIFNRQGLEPWPGNWSMVIYHVPETERPVRQWLRTRLHWLGFGPLAPATWLSPHDRTGEFRAAMESAGIEAQVDFLNVSTDGEVSDTDLARRCWDLDDLASSYRRFVDEYSPRIRRYERGEFGGDAALVEHITLVQEYRAFPFADPDLPRALLPPDWIGTVAHRLFLECYEILSHAAMKYYDDVTAT